jgi:hypothetical protein
MTLHADLRGELAFLRLPRRTHGARLVHRDGQRLLAVAVQVAFQRPVGDEGMRVVRRADDDGVEVFVIEALAPVDVGRGTGKRFSASGKRASLMSHSATTFSSAMEL